MKKLFALTLTVSAVVWLLHIGCSAERRASELSSTKAPAEPVVWINQVNCAAAGTTLKKTRGNNEAADAGASSRQKLTAGDGYLEFTALETDKERYVGLSAAPAGLEAETMDFSLHLTARAGRAGYVAEVREWGRYKAETGYPAKTVFRIAVANGVVSYYKNDEEFYVSTIKPLYPLTADVTLINLGATVSNAALVQGVITKGKLPVVTAPAVVNQPVAVPKADANSPFYGIPDDNKIYIPADYTSFQPPAVGVKYRDTVFGAPIVRLSNGWTQFKDAVHHEYATMSPFNQDDSLILMQADNHGFMVADRNGKLVVPPETLALSNSAEPRWSGNDPNVFYYHAENQLLKFDVARRQKNVVRVFAQYQKITFGGGECDISEDGDHLMIVGDDRHAALYTFSTNSLGKTADLKALGGEWVEVYVTANNNIMARWGSEGIGPHKGMALYDKDFNFVRQIAPFGGHSDQGRDVNSDEVLFVGAYRDNSPPPGCEHNGVEKIRLADAKRSCLLPLNWDAEMHISSNSNGKNPWVLVSVTDTAKGTAAANADLPPDWQRRWGVRFNEVMIVRADGTELRHLAHHRSRTLSSYWFQPRASISKDGKYAVFDSNFGTNPVKDYSDVFLLEVSKQ
ncbi:MAG: hypothetical protein HYR56_05000 [Acidobacteria bacterium]|nr:hypothetical protein [Acidobacteriota bacterium]MBI3426952.1 hypothetical protein [Acidobacteriota bacterium]